MKFAKPVVSNSTIGRLEAKKGLQAVCPVCGEKVISKCGPIKVHHWAHHSSKACDKWWENESAWHRNWKNKFSKKYQEIVLKSSSGEKHVADIYIPHKDLTIEFQKSSIGKKEKESRENFYSKLIWVVHGIDRKINTTFPNGDFEVYESIECRIQREIKRIESLLKKEKGIHFEIQRIDRKIHDQKWKAFTEVISKREATSEIARLEMDKNNETEKLNFLSKLYNQIESKTSILRSLKDSSTILAKKNSYLKGDEEYVVYFWSNQSPIWMPPHTAPVFIDTGSNLLWLINHFVAKKVSYRKFIKRYSI